MLNPDGTYSCGVFNCGGKAGCVHELTREICPGCGKRFLVLVKPTGFKFCSQHPFICDFEVEPLTTKGIR